MESFLDKMDFSDGSVEHSMRRFLTTFRLAGVDSQVVSRIIERFSFKFFERDPLSTFKSKEEAHDFAFLLIVLQTNQHNPSIKMRIDVKQFTEQALANMPLSKDIIPHSYFEQIYNSVTNNSFFTPNSRSLIEDSYNRAIPIEIQIRLKESCSNRGDMKSVELSESEFINTADLTSKQLFHYHNSTHVPPSLLSLAQKHLLSALTVRFLKFAHGENAPSFSIAEQLVALNRLHSAPDLVDRLFHAMYRVALSKEAVFMPRLEQLLWDHFDVLKRSLVLLPRIASNNIIRDDVR